MGNELTHQMGKNLPNCISEDLPSTVTNFDSSLKIEWLNSKEAAYFLRVSVKALRNMTSNGKLPFYKLCRRNRYRKDELESLLRSQKRGHYGN